MGGAFALSRRRRRKRRRPQGWEWFTLYAFFAQLLSLGVGVGCVLAGDLLGPGAAGALGAALLLAGSVIGSTTLWLDWPDQRGARTILYAWLVGEPE